MKIFESQSSLVKRSRRELKIARKGLKIAEKTYVEGGYTGHPEEQLALIDRHRSRIQELQKAQERGWKPNGATIDQARKWLSEFQDEIPEDTPGYERAIGFYLNRVEEAQLGLI